MSWKVEFYSSKILNNVLSWPPRLNAKFLQVGEKIEAIGPDGVGMPHIKALGKGLFEVRVKSDEGIARAMFCILNGKIVMILSEFIKKTQKTPPREIELARKRMKEL